MSFAATGAGYLPSLTWPGGAPVLVGAPVTLLTLPGDGVAAGYDSVERLGDGEWAATFGGACSGLEVTVDDTWRLDAAEEAITLRRRLRVRRSSGTDGGRGVQLHLGLPLGRGGEHRFLAPGMVYSRHQWAPGGRLSFADHRLAYPVVAAFDRTTGRYVCLERISLAGYDDRPDRVAGQCDYLQRTDVGSVGFTASEQPSLHAAWPYVEADTSSMLDSLGSPARAYHPVDDELDTAVTYRVRTGRAGDYVDMVRRVHRPLVQDAPAPSRLPVPFAESIELRLSSAAKTFRRWPDGFAAFVLNFDPTVGYSAEAKAFGASFAEHGMSGSRDILEYGFTGRQLNLAYCLAKLDPDRWLGPGAEVVDSFVGRMATSTGWVYTHWHAGLGRPLFTCGDPSGPVMHYLGVSPVPGTYTRMMAEAGGDLLLNVGLHSEHGRPRQAWLDACARLGEFFLRHQGDDGSWYRAYSPDGEPLTGNDWLSGSAEAGKSATATVIPFLLALSRVAPRQTGGLLAAAIRAGEYVLATQVGGADYRGGTLDNPSVVDKEASFLVMAAMLALYDHTGEPAWLDAAHSAASIAATWHSLWRVPSVPGTALHAAGVSSVGWGGINSTWGVGVTDIYSLFFLADLHRVAVLVGEPELATVAELSAHSSLQLLAVPSDLHGLADVGMQPEGISFCPQGVDDGLIDKGDIWGGLGWTYTAGSHALGRYLAARESGGTPAQ